MRKVKSILLIMLASIQFNCAIVPTLYTKHGTEIDPDFIHGGVTTKEEVLLGSGAPSWTAVDGKMVSYRWTRINGELSCANGFDFGFAKNYDAFIEFDEKDIVKNVIVEVGPPSMERIR